MSVAEPSRLTLPELAAQQGIPIDRLRKRRYELAAAGLLEKIGPNWLARPEDAKAIAERVRSKRAKAPAGGRR